MFDTFTLVVIGILLALLFDFGNGLNDAANAISTVVATRVLPMRTAVIMSAFFNLIAAFVFTTAVAATIGKGLVDPTAVTPLMIVSGLVGAIFWVYLASFMGLPISASHSLIGGFVGAAIAGAGIESILFGGLSIVLLFIFIAPFLGLLGALIFSSIVLRIVKNTPPVSVNKYFQRLQLLSSAVYSLGHGTNDAQKTMGILSILLFSGGFLGGEFYIPFWVVLLSHLTIAAGTLVGGWRVVKTMGLKITKLRPIHGFSAETSGAGVIIGSTLFGIPVSTTHVISGAIFGVGITRRLSAVKWKIARGIVVAWIVTIPITAFIGGIAFLLFNSF